MTVREAIRVEKSRGKGCRFWFCIRCLKTLPFDLRSRQTIQDCRCLLECEIAHWHNVNRPQNTQKTQNHTESLRVHLCSLCILWPITVRKRHIPGDVKKGQRERR